MIVDFSFGFQRGRQYVLGMTQFKLIADPVEGIFLSFLFSTDVCIEVQGPVGPQRDLLREGPRRSSSAARSGRFVLRQPAATSSWDLSVIESSHVLSAAICWSCFPGPSFFFLLPPPVLQDHATPFAPLWPTLFLAILHVSGSLISDDVSWSRPHFLLEK